MLPTWCLLKDLLKFFFDFSHPNALFKKTNLAFFVEASVMILEKKANRKLADMISVERSNKSLSSNPVELSSSECSQSLADVPPVRELRYRPSKSFIFPKAKVGARNCCFNTNGLNSFLGCIMTQCKYLFFKVSEKYEK